MLLLFIPDKSSIASNPAHVEVETCPVNASPVTNIEVMIEPNAAEKINVSAGLEKFRFQILRVKILPTFRKPSRIKRNRTIAICEKEQKV